VRGLAWRQISFRNRVALVFFAITVASIGSLYLYVAPGLQSRLIDDKLAELASDASGSGRIAQTVGSAVPLPSVHALVNAAGLASGQRVTLLLITRGPDGVELSALADSSNAAAAARLRFPVAYRTASSGRPGSGIESAAGKHVAEAATPVFYRGRVQAVIVFSASVSDIVGDVAVVRHEILVAGGIALLLAVIAGYLVARTFGRRLRRLELAAGRVAAGHFEHPIPVDSSDELGQLARAFNEMQGRLSQLESARKKFIATASHELRTPIFSLGGFVELLQDEDLDPETRRRFLDQLAEQVERLRKLSVDLLDLSRLESGSLELRPEPVDLGELTRSVSGEFEPSLAQHDAHLELHLPARRMEAHCDPVRVAQIVRILIDNALTHTPQGTRIVVTAARENGQVLLAVRDDGEGIDATTIRRIFEPFYTADGAQGSGLGLTIASELAERMQGRLSVQSTTGQTIFTLKIPVASDLN
jgi:two-component system, OmpR family, sensor kinase